MLMRIFQKFVAAHFGHADVRDDQVRHVAGEQPFDGVQRILHVMAVVIRLEVCVKNFGDLLLVVYDQYLFLVHVGSFVAVGVSQLCLSASGACRRGHAGRLRRVWPEFRQ